MATSDISLLETFQKHIEDMRNLSLCKICIKPFYEPFILPCGHSYCYSCLSSWFGGGPNRKRQRNCPDCRAPVRLQPSPNYLLRDLVHMFISRTELLPEDETVQEHEKGKTEEAELLANDRAGLGLFKGVFMRTDDVRHPPQFMQRFRSPIRDPVDNVDRCPMCTWELEEGMCIHCGYGDSGDDDDDEEDEDEDSLSSLGTEDTGDTHTGAVEDGSGVQEFRPWLSPNAGWGLHPEQEPTVWQHDQTGDVSSSEENDQHMPYGYEVDEDDDDDDEMDGFIEDEEDEDTDEEDESDDDSTITSVSSSTTEGSSESSHGPPFISYEEVETPRPTFFGVNEYEGDSNNDNNPQLSTNDSNNGYSEQDLNNGGSQSDDDSVRQMGRRVARNITRSRPIVVSDEEEDKDDEDEDSDDTAIRPPQSHASRRQRLNNQRAQRSHIEQRHSSYPGVSYHGTDEAHPASREGYSRGRANIRGRMARRSRPFTARVY